MKKIYLFFLIFIVYSEFQGQNPACTDADSNLIYAYSNVKDSYESNNIQHLKYYADKSLKSFGDAKINLKECGCDAAFELAYNAMELIEKVEKAPTYEDGRYFVKKAKEITQNSITELNKCTIPKNTESVATATERVGNDLDALQQEKEKLEQQRLALKLKEEEILKKLDAQKSKELQLQKEMLIKEHKAALNLNISTCNKVLKTYGSTSELPSYDKNDTDLLSENVEAIKAYYLNITKDINMTYLEKLNLIKIN
ncbi:hypothetical protein CJ739_2808 [Mariniflexile rhizosphaerae]|uniref:hypothetical protein n=1 Tax=unclassified Mariniflexile TaxID=2643887 RepID=UPI000CAF9E3E|nr:hypothetical protein [Mariniflexile sp. TRM1-10]AXP81874.1 hypothetical protein CJ739_2808 [Mariniflexile sp. TRM1-10]PLB20738.1 MAG: hypothetical protein TRG1_306 [Flavobacteriaceae bacterium FS1-H7996/R]